MSMSFNLVRISAACLLLAAGASVSADTETEFTRIALDEDDRPTALQMSINSYSPGDGNALLSVDLVGAIHIGDPSYYAELNDRFRDYDVLLYELVAPLDAAARRNSEKSKGLLSTTQVGLTKLLDLSFQLDEINYDRANFVHADLSPKEVRESMNERGESFYVYFWRIFFASIDEYAKDPLGLRDIELMSAMLRRGEDDSLKTLIAYEMTNMEQLQDILGDDSSSTIIGARNQRAIDVLQREIDAGAKHIGIFYGVAHMPDMEARLYDQLGLKHEKTHWVDAWKLGAQPEPAENP